MISNTRPMRSTRCTAHSLQTFAIVMVTACASGDATGGQVTSTTPDSGPLRVSVTRVPANAGIILVDVSGGPMSNIALTPGYQSVANAVDDTHATILVRGTLQAGTMATITVPDRKVSYHVAVIDAAAGRAGGYARQTADQFALTIAP